MRGTRWCWRGCAPPAARSRPSRMRRACGSPSARRPSHERMAAQCHAYSGPVPCLQWPSAMPTVAQCPSGHPMSVCMAAISRALRCALCADGILHGARCVLESGTRRASGAAHPPTTRLPGYHHRTNEAGLCIRSRPGLRIGPRPDFASGQGRGSHRAKAGLRIEPRPGFGETHTASLFAREGSMASV